MGDVSAWMTNALAGINADVNRPGFSHIIVRPYFVKKLDWAKGEYQSVNGLVRSEWERKGDKVILRVSIPANTTATVYADKMYEIKSGEYHFVLK